jgi:hypothetical protein
MMHDRRPLNALLIKNLLNYVTTNCIGLVFVYQVVLLPIILGCDEWGMPQSLGLGCHSCRKMIKTLGFGCGDSPVVVLTDSLRRFTGDEESGGRV